MTSSQSARLPSNARFACQAIVTQLHAVQIEISGRDKRVTQTHRAKADGNGSIQFRAKAKKIS